MQSAIAARHTQRDPFDERPVEPEVIDALRRAAEADNPEYRDEMASWASPLGQVLDVAEAMPGVDNGTMVRRRRDYWPGWSRQ
jgi:hypothetical protein